METFEIEIERNPDTYFSDYMTKTINQFSGVMNLKSKDKDEQLEWLLNYGDEYPFYAEVVSKWIRED